jgi:nucleoside-triphosphatase THEP1
MELLSPTFRDLVPTIFEAPCVLATAGEHHDPLLDDLRRRSDVHIVFVHDADPAQLADLVTDVRASAQ